MATQSLSDPPVTPDGRYIVVRGRLWRRANPGLDDAARESLVRELMAARRAVGAALRGADRSALDAARARVAAAKTGLGERGPVWWDDGAPDENRRMARNSRYADWFAALEASCGRRSSLGSLIVEKGQERRSWHVDAGAGGMRHAGSVDRQDGDAAAFLMRHQQVPVIREQQ